MSTEALKNVATGKIAVKKNQTVAQILHSSVMKEQIRLALPKHISAERIARIALTEIKKNEKLAGCDKDSFLGALMQCAQLGLEPGSGLGHAYLLPFRNAKRGIMEAQFIIGYRGMIDLARRSGQIISISAHTVHENDTFSYEFGLHEDLKHIPADSDRGQMTHVYAVARLKDGGVQFEVLSKFEVNKIREDHSTKFNDAWRLHYDEMAKKTVIRRLFKYLPVSVEMTRAVIADETAEAGLSQDNASFITGEYSAVDDEYLDSSLPVEVNKDTGEILQPEQDTNTKTVSDDEEQFKSLLQRIQNATDIDVLDLDADQIRDMRYPKHREELTNAYQAKRAQLKSI